MSDPKGIRNLIWAVVAAVFVCIQPMVLSAQTTFNLAKEVGNMKSTIVWRNAPADALPRPVCTILDACGGQTKLIVLPATTEGGKKVARGLFLTRSLDGKSDVIILERQTVSDKYFYRLGPDGNLQKTAFIQLGAKAWSPIASSLVKPTFDKEKKIWHDHVMKLGKAHAAQGN